MEDKEIIELYWERNPAAVSETEKAYGSRLTKLAMGILESREDADESVNDTYLAAWRTMPPQRPSFLFAYLAKICRNASFGRLDWQNAKKRKAEVVTLSQELEQCLPDVQATRAAELSALKEVLNRFLGELSEENRLIFLRRYWFGDSVREIAQRFSCSESRVKVTLFRLRGKLRAKLEQEGLEV